MTAIVVENLSKTYRVAVKRETGVWSAVKGLFHREFRTVRAVDDISFRIERGAMVAFLGPNGAGKTTTLKMLSGLIHPTAGAATVLGFVPWERPNEFRRRFALVMGQKNQLWWDLPVRESFRLHREIYSIPPDEFKAIHDELIDLLRLGELIGQPVRELSLGERMKMELVAALLHQPEVLFLDEPTIGLDVVAQVQLREFLRDYNKRHGVTVVLTSHYMRDVESLCERAIVINHGKLVCDERLESIVARFSREKVARLRFAGDAPEGLERFGVVAERRGPIATLRLPRAEVAAILARLLAEHQLDDITIDEVPLEQVIAEVFDSAPSPTGGGMTFAQSLRAYRTIFAICVAERLTYRTDFLLGTFMRFMPIVTTIFLWRAIFQGAGGGKIAGFDDRSIVAYYLMTMIARAFSSMPGLASSIAADVRTGAIKKYLTQPMDLVGFLLASRMAHKCVYYGIALVPFATIFYVCRGFFPPAPPPEVVAAVVASLCLSFMIGFAFEAWVGCWGFWLLEISSINFIVMMLVYVMSGHMFPLDLAPEPYATVMRWLPFQYLAYFPAKLYLSETDGWVAWAAVGRQAMVAIGLFVLLRVTYRMGLRRYSAFGG